MVFERLIIFLSSSFQGGYDNGREDDIYVEGTPSTPVRTDDVYRNNNYGDQQTRRPNKSHSTSFFAQPGTLAGGNYSQTWHICLETDLLCLSLAVVGGAVVGLLCAILCVMFVVYRMRKKDEGSYALDEPKRSPTVNSYSKPPSREFYA